MKTLLTITAITLIISNTTVSGYWELMMIPTCCFILGYIVGGKEEE